MKYFYQNLIVVTIAWTIALPMAMPSEASISAADIELWTPYDVDQAPWPSWHGPYFNGSAPEQDIDLVPDFTQAKVVWESEDEIPWAHPKGSSYWTGGYATPIVAQNRVYLSYWRPSGRTSFAFTKEDLARGASVKNRRNAIKGLSDISSDDVLHCFDLKTGKTLWRSVQAGRGVLRGGSKDGCHMSPCWWNGKVYFGGSSDRLYCIDADTGELIWDKDNEHSAQTENTKKRGELNKSAPRAFYRTPTALDGVVVWGNTAYDADTGEHMWQVPTAGLQALPWQYQGTTYVLVGPSLVELKTGKVCWTIEKGKAGPKWGMYGSFAGNVLFLYYLREPFDRNVRYLADVGPRAVSAFKTTPTGLSRIWTLDAPPRRHYLPPLIHRGLAYVSLQFDPDDRFKGNCSAFVDIRTGAHTVINNGDTRASGGAKGHAPIGAEGRIIGIDTNRLSYHEAGKPVPGYEPPADIYTADSTSPAYANGFLFFRRDDLIQKSPGRLVCYDLRRHP